MAGFAAEGIGELDVRLQHHVSLGAKLQRALHDQFPRWILRVVAAVVIPPQEIVDVLLRGNAKGAHLDRVEVDRVDRKNGAGVGVQRRDRAVGLGGQEGLRRANLEPDLQVLSQCLVEAVGQAGGQGDTVGCIAARAGLYPDFVVVDFIGNGSRLRFDGDEGRVECFEVDGIVEAQEPGFAGLTAVAV